MAVVLDEVWQSHRRRSRRGGLRMGRRRWALKGVSMAVAPGELGGVVGRNGSGKTTLLRVVGAIVRPARGSVRVDGRVSTLLDLTPGLDRDLTGAEHMRVRAVLGGLSKREVADLWDEMTAFTGISADQLAEPLHTYSAGMVLRVAAAAALVPRCDTVVVDEVLAVGDASFQHQCLRRVAELVDAGASAILVSHDARLILDNCERTLVLDEGLLMADGASSDILADDLDTVLASHRAAPDSAR